MRPAATATRVESNTAPTQNQRIRAESARAVARHGGSPDAIAGRLSALRREWDVERMIETEAPLAILAGIVLGAGVDRRFLGLSGIAAAMLLVHNMQGWYPLLPVLRRARRRTTREIHEEARLLKCARGDFARVPGKGSPEERALAAYQAAAL